jgi:hypothetical protein
LRNTKSFWSKDVGFATYPKKFTLPSPVWSQTALELKKAEASMVAKIWYQAINLNH